MIEPANALSAGQEKGSVPVSNSTARLFNRQLVQPKAFNEPAKRTSEPRLFSQAQRKIRDLTSGYARRLRLYGAACFAVCGHSGTSPNFLP